MTEPAVYDVAVVGGGPAGLAAAGTAVAGGLRVALLDAGHALGGQYWRQPADDALASARAAVGHDERRRVALTGYLATAARGGAVDLLTDHEVWAVSGGPSAGGAPREDRDFTVHAVDTTGATTRAVLVRSRALVLATGAYDRALPFPGWDLPGVTTAGGLQALLTAHDLDVAGHRVALGGTGPFLLPVAAALAVRGARVVGVFEAAAPAQWLRHWRAATLAPSKLAEGARYAATLAAYRVRYRTGAMIVRAHGETGVTAIDWAPLRGGRPDLTAIRTEPVDHVGIGWGFVPHTDLAATLGCRHRRTPDGALVVTVDEGGRTSVPGVYAAGESVGVGGARLALREGQRCADTLLADLGRPAATSATRARAIAAETARLRRFADALHHVYRVPSGWQAGLTPDTVACRCEEVTVAAIARAVDGGARDVRQVKQLTRAGMGWCQGRICEPGVALLAGDDAARTVPTPRPLAVPVAMRDLAAEPGPPAAGRS